jgi:YD repeat-containing protein
MAGSHAGLVSAAEEVPELERGFSADSAFSISSTGTVNLFNGALTVPVPIGAPTPVSPFLELGVTFFYNSNSWDILDDATDGAPWCGYLENDMGGVPYGTSDTVDYPIPGRIYNAGLGWRLAPGGQLFMKDEEPYLGEELHLTNIYIRGHYVASDGSSHTFTNLLHRDDTEVAGVSYTTDGSRLRKRIVSGTECQALPAGQTGCHLVEHPNGLVEEFAYFGGWPAYRLTQKRDRFGNAVNLVYDETAKTITLTDTHGRWLRMTFADATFKKLLSVTRPAFGGGESTWVFQYETKMVYRPRYGLAIGFCTGYGTINPDGTCQSACDDGIPTLDPNGAHIHVPDEPIPVDFLVRMINPDRSYYQMDYDDKGELNELRFPTRLTARWEYEPNRLTEIPMQSENRRKKIKYVTQRVTTKQLFDDPETSEVLAQWSYEIKQASFVGDFPYSVSMGRCYVSVKETEPTGDYSISYFQNSRSYVLENFSDRGLPYTYCDPETQATDWENGPFLSKEIYTAGGTKLRSEYVEYEHDSPGPIEIIAHDHRVIHSRAKYHREGGNTYQKDLTYSDYDGLGHYRTATLTSDFPYGSTHSSFYSGFNPLDYQGNYTGPSYTPPSTDPWLLDLYAEIAMSEGAHSARTLYCFDLDTGFLNGTRVLETESGPGPGDVIVRNIQHSTSPGFVEEVRYFGGDTVAAGTENRCSPDAGTPASFEKKLDYSYGVLSSEAFVDCSDEVVLQMQDNVIDPATGLVSSSTRPDGLVITYGYDTMGRVTKAQPGEGAWTRYTYQRSKWLAATQEEEVKANLVTQQLCAEGGGSCAAQKTTKWFTGSTLKKQP